MKNELKYCTTCGQMTNHGAGLCLKHKESVGEGWEKEFDEEDFDNGKMETDYSKVKSFIRSTIASAVKEEREKIYKEVLQMYRKDFSHMTRDYKPVDQFRDKVLNILITKPN